MVQIYHCPNCGKKLDKLALLSFWQRKKFKRAEEQYNAVLNYSIKSGPEITWFFFLNNFNCGCGRQFTSIHRTRFEYNFDLPFLRNDFKLVHIEGGTFDYLEGIKTGKTIKGMLAAFLTRWNCLSNLSIICTPFISSKFTSGEWEWLLKKIHPFKIFIITRPQSFRLLKRLPIFEAKDGNDLMNLWAKSEEEDITAAFEQEIMNPWAAEESTYRFQKFHAKFFAGILPDRVEVLHTSYNLFKCQDRQLENLALRTYPRDHFMFEMIRPFKIKALNLVPDTSLELVDEVGCVICKQKDGEFTSTFHSYKNSPWEVICEVFKN